MKKLICLCSGVVLCLTARAQFYATNLPSVFGSYNCSYFSTNNVDVPTMLTLTTNSGGLIPPGSGPTWDFSQSQQSYETILRTDIVAPSNGMDSASFPDATYSEQDTTETLTYTNQSAWRYYTITNEGRTYYGFYVPGTIADGLAVFDPPTVDIPATVTNGQSWSRSTGWNSLIYSGGDEKPATFYFSDFATVDAQGTLILPDLGAFQALRVHETHDYNLVYRGGSVYTETNQYYYWLVQQLGVAAQITIYGNIFEGGLTATPIFTNSVERMYYANYYTNQPPLPHDFTGNLFIHLQSGAIGLNWLPFTNSLNLVSTGYQVQASSSLPGTNWQVMGLTNGTNWSDTLSSTQRFYRVLGFP
jgi:hypothetical protein